MSHEQNEKIDVNKDHVDDYTDNEVTSNQVIINRKDKSNIQELTIATIQDNKDRNDRLKLIKYNSKLRSSYKDQRKGKKGQKRKLIQYDYGKEDDYTDTIYKPINQIQKTRSNVECIGANSQAMSEVELSPSISNDYSEIVESKEYMCSLILENFDNLNLIELFNDNSNPLLQMNLFHLYIYSIVHKQDKYFLESNSGLFDSELFMKILSNLLQVKELNHNFASKFRSEDGCNTEKNLKGSAIKGTMKKRVIEKIDVPSIILKRLDITKEN